jgi:hypothetical protein
MISKRWEGLQMTQGQAQGSQSHGRSAARGVAVGVATCLIIACTLRALSVHFGGVDVAVAIVAGGIVGGTATWLRSATPLPSTRVGTTRFMFILAVASGLGGPIAGTVCMVHTTEPGCEGWVGCGTNHSLIGSGVLCIVIGLSFAAVFGALGLIARTVGEMQAAGLDRSTSGERAIPA